MRTNLSTDQSTAFKLSAYHVSTDVLAASEGGSPLRLVYATRTGRSLQVREDLYQKLRSGDFRNVSTKTLLTLFEIEVLVPSTENEFLTILERNREAIKSSQLLNVTIQPTADCQLGCNYCGQTHRKTAATPKISAKITDRIIANLAKRKRKHLHVQWFGAEPLMAYKEIIRMSDRLIQYCDETGVNYAAHMITNGLSFKPPVFQELLSRKIKHYQITLDGLAETHDIMRISKKGEKTFDIILRNIISVATLPEFQEQGCGIVVRININRTNAHKVPQLIDLLASHNLQKRGVSLDFQPIVDWGDNEASKSSYSLQDFASLEIDWILHAQRNGFVMGGILPPRRTQPCMVVEQDGEVYDAEGNIYPCYEFPYTAAYEGPEYRIGNVETIDTEKNEHAITRTWFTDIETDISPCKTCNLFPVCGGSCPKKWYQGEVACPSFKINIVDRLVLDYLNKKTVRTGDKARASTGAHA